MSRITPWELKVPIVAVVGGLSGMKYAAYTQFSRNPEVPRDSLLFKASVDATGSRRGYKDCFEIPAGDPHIRRWVRQKRPDADIMNAYARAFFRSNAFKKERTFLKLTGSGSVTDCDIEHMKFVPGDSVSVFKVIERTDNEILFDSGDTFTWMRHCPADDGRILLQFGSAIKKHPTDSTSNFFVPIHKMYSRVLISAALWKLNEDATLSFKHENLFVL